MDKIEQLKMSIGQLGLSVTNLESRVTAFNGQNINHDADDSNVQKLSELNAKVEATTHQSNIYKNALNRAVNDIDKIILQIGEQ